jgi:hypothetical protein
MIVLDHATVSMILLKETAKVILWIILEPM